MRRTFSISTSCFAHAALILSGLVMLAILYLWLIGHRVGGVEWYVRQPQARFLLASRSGRLIVGVDTPMSNRALSWYMPTPIPPLNQLLNDDDQYVLLQPNAWGIAVPHWSIMLLL